MLSSTEAHLVKENHSSLGIQTTKVTYAIDFSKELSTPINRLVPLTTVGVVNTNKDLRRKRISASPGRTDSRMEHW